MQKYDYIIAGGGCAGLTLAYKMACSSLCQKRILIIDKAIKQRNDRTWSFWTNKATDFDTIVYKSWQNIEFITDSRAQVFPLPTMQYKTIRGIDFYDFVDKKLSEFANIERKQETITQIQEVAQGIDLHTEEGGHYRADFIFDSCFSPDDLNLSNSHSHYLLQHFKGYVLRTAEDSFDDSKVRMFDFRVPQRNAVRFFYILPFSKREALVEYTIFSQSLEQEADYEIPLRTYIDGQLALSNYEIIETEFGVIPMTDYAFERKISARHMSIGTKAGMAKATTGYAFLRIQRDADAIVASLIKKNTPFYDKFKKNSLIRYNDTLLLDIMERDAERIRPIFIDLFNNNPIERLLGFLDEQISTIEIFKIMLSVPSAPFIKSIGRDLHNKTLTK
ncbi:MAG: lycopene cyclase [Bernardetiaceae bacterium]|nr:lycopene cyclase [Bernardetiaceae bacterium]